MIDRHHIDIASAREPCAGIDGCRAGWVVATRTGVTVVTDLAEVLDRVDVVGVDMPMGLALLPGRRVDEAARRRLGPRRASVFDAPPRPILPCTTHAQANAESRALYGVGVSAQAFNLFAKIREVDALVRALPLDDRDARVHEAHPECSFRELSGTDLPSKHTPEGIAARRALVEAEFGAVPDVPRGARLDDVLDAHAVLWSIERFARGDHVVVPDDDPPERDEFGTAMRLVI